MQLANCWLVLHKEGNNVPLMNITPPELVLLAKEHEARAGKFPIHDLVINEQEWDAEDADEKQRLRMKYGFVPGSKPPQTKIDAIYSGEGAKLPQTFKETGLLKKASITALAEPEPEPTTIIMTPSATEEEPTTESK